MTDRGNLELPLGDVLLPEMMALGWLLYALWEACWWLVLGLSLWGLVGLVAQAQEHAEQ